jgi:hypothetical protein
VTDRFTFEADVENLQGEFGMMMAAPGFLSISSITFDDKFQEENSAMDPACLPRVGQGRQGSAACDRRHELDGDDGSVAFVQEVRSLVGIPQYSTQQMTSSTLNCVIA